MDVDVVVDVVVDLVVDTTGHPLATDVPRCRLGRARGTFGASCLQSLRRVQVHVHDYVHDYVHVHVHVDDGERRSGPSTARAIAPSLFPHTL